MDNANRRKIMGSLGLLATTLGTMQLVLQRREAVVGDELKLVLSTLDNACLTLGTIALMVGSKDECIEAYNALTRELAADAPQRRSDETLH